MITHVQPDTYAVEETGTFIISDCGFCGLGSLLGSAASWLPYATGPVYVYMSNHIYAARDYWDSANKFNWFFDQHIYPIPYVIRVGVNTQAINQSQHNSIETIVKLRDLASKKWTVKQNLLREASSYVESPLTTLGVHYRGTDKGCEIVPTELAHVADLIADELRTKQFTNVLLATDDDRALAYLLDRFPKLNFFRNHIRGSDENGIHFKHGSYKQAYEAMVEVMALGMCKHLVVGRSSLADMILILARNENITWRLHN